jgi:SAM-dependent methyltransferase
VEPFPWIDVLFAAESRDAVDSSEVPVIEELTGELEALPPARPSGTDPAMRPTVRLAQVPSRRPPRTPTPAAPARTIQSTPPPPPPSSVSSASQPAIPRLPAAVAPPARAPGAGVDFEDLHTGAGRPAPTVPPPDDELSDLVREVLDDGAPVPAAVPDDWWARCFDESYLATLPRNLGARTARECRFVVESLALPDGARVLDVACGFGRHAIELAARGYAVAGIDFSRPLLEIGRQESQRRGLSVSFTQGDMRSLDFRESFAGAVCLDTSFGYFDDRTNCDVLRSVQQALVPGGRFVLEVSNRDWVVGRVPRRTWFETDTGVVLDDVTFDHAASRLVVQRNIAVGAQPPVERHSSIRMYALHELLSLLRIAGFRIVETSGSIAHRGRYLGAENRSLWVLAERPR